ncbi:MULTISPECIES: hypothetical protein [unclassified Tolypothrix]|uniref:hypothetical protein n=1 Tax=unclassified Tolypothrix TaxID=2649714 RepID=UPI0005EAC5B0|nr:MULTISPECIES: hypothetical protein [unclassified Tolypothrix]BAY93734.1 hypothetical protein NIES3275_57760 [Microchaete diplosiphon NIES-3275]EKF03262.1 hypothetical protein FDUTEX481_02720 [Tolypothrix sp. PCC 7601]MBE9082537.1 hypothetical protein [Tolypothrix sp. LEGE 11397]UYD27541.1 hypothetical protein HGR01_05525 [Tolypothrix sp. PCC 7712]UYD36597.1 hypothetical protein HG267_13185 [Tolypothrix sp. PCC 7601]
MTDSHSLFSSYEELVQNHARQFDPHIAQLQQLVTTRMQELRAAEQTLVDAQAIELQNIFNALATDARCLLPTPEFRTFVQELKQTQSHNWYTRKSEFSIAEDPTTWLLATLELPIGLSNYQIQEDLDGYDDERNYIGYSYTLSLRFGSVEHLMEILYKRIYNVNDRTETSIKEQIDYYIWSEVEDLLTNMPYPKEQKKQLAQEISVLVGYSSKVFALKPRTAIFEYSSATQEQ